MRKKFRFGFKLLTFQNEYQGCYWIYQITLFERPNQSDINAIRAISWINPEDNIRHVLILKNSIFFRNQKSLDFNPKIFIYLNAVFLSWSKGTL